MKSYGVAIQMKPLQQYFHMVLFIEYVVLTFEKSCGVTFSSNFTWYSLI